MIYVYVILTGEYHEGGTVRGVSAFETDAVVFCDSTYRAEPFGWAKVERHVIGNLGEDAETICTRGL